MASCLYSESVDDARDYLVHVQFIYVNNVLVASLGLVSQNVG